MPVINTIFFDLFNTLISVGEVPVSVGRFTADVLEVDHEHWNNMCFSEEHDICQPTNHLQVLTVLARQMDPSMPLQRIEQAVLHRQKRFDYALTNVNPDILNSLSELRLRGYRLALISNASTAEVMAWSGSPLADLMEQVVFSCESGCKKPQASIYQHALQKMQVSATDSLFVGDGGSNELQGAQEVGLTTVLTTQFSKPHRVQKVRQTQGQAIQYEISHLREIIGLLENKGI